VHLSFLSNYFCTWLFLDLEVRQPNYCVIKPNVDEFTNNDQFAEYSTYRFYMLIETKLCSLPPGECGQLIDVGVYANYRSLK
jgi:hypothetical protein